MPDLQTGIGTAAYFTLDTEQHISHTRMALVDTSAFLQNLDGRVIPVQEVLKLLTENHDIQDNAMSKWVDNTGHILVCLLVLHPGSLMKSGLHSTPFFTT